MGQTENVRKPNEIPVFSDLDRGWAWVVLVASFIALMMIGTCIYAVGIIHIAMLERYRQDVSRTSWVGAVHSAMIAGAAPISTALIDRFSCRVALVTSGCLFIIGYMATAFAPDVDVCIFTCGIIAGCGGAAGYTAAIVVIGLNFRHKRNLAMGFSISGVGAGMLVIAPLFEAAREYYGNSGFFIALAGINANLIVCGMLCFPSKLELYTQKKRRQDILQQTNKKQHSQFYSVLKFYLRVAIKKPVICLCFCLFNYGFGTSLVFLHLPNYAVHVGSTSIQGSLLISICGIMGLIGRILTGIIANFEKIDEIVLYAGSMLVVSIATFLFQFYSYTFAGQVVYVCFLGLFFGSCYVLITSVNIRFAGVKCMAAATGLQFFWFGIGAVVGPVVAGVLVDQGGTYEQSFMIAGFFILVASILAAATVCFSSPRVPEFKLLDTELEIKGNQTVCDKHEFETFEKIPDINEESSERNIWAKEEQETLTENY